MGGDLSESDAERTLVGAGCWRGVLFWMAGVEESEGGTATSGDGEEAPTVLVVDVALGRATLGFSGSSGRTIWVAESVASVDG